MISVLFNMYLLLLFCVVCVTIAEFFNSDHSGNIIEYELGEVLQFFCNNSSKRHKSYRMRHELNGINITVPNDTGYKYNLIYTITANDFDHQSKIFCIRKQDINKNEAIESEPKILHMKSVPDKCSAIHEIRYGGDNTAKHYCNKTNSMSRIDVEKRLTEIKEKFVPLNKADSGSVFFCGTLKPHAVNYTRKIYNKIKYTYDYDAKMRNERKLWFTIGAAAEIVVILILGTILLFLRKKRHRLTHLTTRSNEEVEQIYGTPHQVVYAELELANRTPSGNVLSVREETPYAQIIGYLAKQ